VQWGQTWGKNSNAAIIIVLSERRTEVQSIRGKSRGRLVGKQLEKRKRESKTMNGLQTKTRTGAEESSQKDCKSDDQNKREGAIAGSKPLWNRVNYPCF